VGVKGTDRLRINALSSLISFLLHHAAARKTPKRGGEGKMGVEAVAVLKDLREAYMGGERGRRMRHVGEVFVKV
jgi:hypothetical protein